MYSFSLNDGDVLMQEFYEDKDFRDFFFDLKNDHNSIADNSIADTKRKKKGKQKLILQQKIDRIGLLTKLVDTTIDQKEKDLKKNNLIIKNENEKKININGKKVGKKRKLRKTFIEKCEGQKIRKKKITKIQKNQGECGCNCKKSKCLKLYCVCFASKRFCNAECNCRGCSNIEVFIAEIEKAQEIVLKKDKGAFDAKIQAKEHTKGCRCKRSRCLKKYCECFQSNVYCGDICGCVKGGCQNFEGSECLEKMFGKKKNGVGPRNMLVTSQPLRGVKK